MASEIYISMRLCQAHDDGDDDDDDVDEKSIKRASSRCEHLQSCRCFPAGDDDDDGDEPKVSRSSKSVAGATQMGCLPGLDSNDDDEQDETTCLVRFHQLSTVASPAAAAI